MRLLVDGENNHADRRWGGSNLNWVRALDHVDDYKSTIRMASCPNLVRTQRYIRQFHVAHLKKPKICRR